MAQIKKKFIADNAVDGSKILLENNESIRVKSTVGSDVELFKLDSSNILQFLTLPRLASDPSDGGDMVRKSYLDGQLAVEVAARIAGDLAEQTAREAAVAAEQSRAEAAEDALQSAIDDEETRALAAEAALQAGIDALDTGNAQALAGEVAARTAGEAALQSAVDAEKARIDAILLASDADKDSFAEIVNLINSVDTENDSAFASYVLSNNAALAQEVSDRTAGDAAVQAAVDAEEARALAAEGVLQDNIDSEEERAMAAEGALSDRLDIVEGSDSVEGSVAKAEKDAKDFAQGLVDAEQSARESADSTLQSNIDAEASARQAADATLQSNIAAETSARQMLQLDLSEELEMLSGYCSGMDNRLQSSINEEASTRQAADTDLQNQINNILSNTDPAALDSLAEVVAAFQSADGDLNSAISALGSSASSALTQETSDRQAADAAEASARQAADATLQSNIDAEEAARIAAVSAEETARIAGDAAEAAAREAQVPRFAKLAATLSGTDISNGYVDLTHVAKELSVNVFLDRLACHAGDDYTLSTVGGVTRVTFTTTFKESEEGPAAGDLFRCSYTYANEDQSSGGGGGGGGGGEVNPNASVSTWSIENVPQDSLGASGQNIADLRRVAVGNGSVEAMSTSTITVKAYHAPRQVVGEQNRFLTSGAAAEFAVNGVVPAQVLSSIPNWEEVNSPQWNEVPNGINFATALVGATPGEIRMFRNTANNYWVIAKVIALVS